MAAVLSMSAESTEVPPRPRSRSGKSSQGSWDCRFHGFAYLWVRRSCDYSVENIDQALLDQERWRCHRKKPAKTLEPLGFRMSGSQLLLFGNAFLAAGSSSRSSFSPGVASTCSGTALDWSFTSELSAYSANFSPPSLHCDIFWNAMIA
jgi:hypothetical protein